MILQIGDSGIVLQWPQCTCRSKWSFTFIRCSLLYLTFKTIISVVQWYSSLSLVCVACKSLDHKGTLVLTSFLLSVMPQVLLDIIWLIPPWQPSEISSSEVFQRISWDILRKNKNHVQNVMYMNKWFVCCIIDNYPLFIGITY